MKLLKVLFLLPLMLAGCVNSNVVSMAEYNQVNNGMSYSEVVAIVGEEGEENSNSTMPAVPGVMDAITTKGYMWQNANGSNMMCMFQNDKLITKAQAGL